MTKLKQTPVFPEYMKYGAKTIDFGGWELPVQFSKIQEEHEVTRTSAALFDVSHMGEILVSGSDAKEFLQIMTTNNLENLEQNKAHYTFLCNERGGVMDDFLLYMLEEDKYLLVVNAANTKKDLEWLVKHQKELEHDVMIQDLSEDCGLLALQGPLAEDILQKLTDTDLTEIKPFRFQRDVVLNGFGKNVLLSRSGYTGEDGFEVYVSSSHVAQLWNFLLNAGKHDGLVPAGLGARDTLRFEANLPLYGQELTEEITPIEAGLNFAVKIDKPTDFIGKEVLKEQIEHGPPRKIVGIQMIDKGIPRTNYDVFVEDQWIGHVTSGTRSPTLQQNIGLVLIDSNFAELGRELEIQVRKRKLKAKIVPTPFYKREK